MIKLSELLNKVKPIKWIIGYVDAYGKVHYKIVYFDDLMDSHNKVWPFIHHNKWRWKPSQPYNLNTYNDILDDDSIDKIWATIDKYKS